MKISLERIVTVATSIQVDASSPEEAFTKAKAGECIEVASTTTSTHLIRDYPVESAVTGPIVSVV